jgi:hypothetical protein
MNVNIVKILVLYCFIFQSVHEHNVNVNNVSAKFKHPSTEVRTAGFTGYLNVSHKRVK